MTYYGPTYADTKVGRRTFPSGLVEEKFRRTCRSTHVNSCIPTGSNIFPAPDISYGDNGLATIEWSTYSNLGGFRLQYGTELITISKSFSESVTSDGKTTQYNWTILEIWLSDTVTKSSVINATTNAWGLYFDADCNKVLKERKISGKRISSGATSISISWNTQIIAVTRRNYGALDEAEITVGNVASY